MKKCCKCKVFKPLGDFGANKSAKDGLSFECRACTKAYRDKRLAERGDEVREADRARFHTEKRQATIERYRSSDKGKAAAARARASWRSKHPKRQYAANEVSRALRTGKLVKQPCFICGVAEVEGHHPDYSRYTDVIWLCVPHHKEVHRMAQDMGVEFA